MRGINKVSTQDETGLVSKIYIQNALFKPPTTWTPTPVSKLPSWEGAKRVAIDVETYDPYLTKLGPGVRRGGYIVGVSFAIEDGPAYYLPIRHGSGENLNEFHVLSYLGEQIDNFTGIVVGANLQYDLDYIATWMQANKPFYRARIFRDVMVADPLINELHSSYSLEAISKRWGFSGKDETPMREAAARWGIDPTRRKRNDEVKANLWKLPPEYVAEYAISDVVLPLQILRKQEAEIKRQKLESVYDLESRLLPVLLKMRRRGVRIDLKKLQKIEDWALQVEQQEMASVGLTIEDTMRASTLAPRLEEIGIKIPVTPKSGEPSVSADLLEDHPHKLTNAILRARQFFKLRGTFCQQVRDQLIGDRAHCTFNQLKYQREGRAKPEGAGFGRCSSSNFNIQNQPIRNKEFGKTWREIFIPEEGEVWAKCDFSCYDEATEVLTPDGWVKFPELRDQNIAQWETSGKISFVRPQAVHQYSYNGKMIHFKGKLIDQLVTPNHDMVFQTKTGKIFKHKAEVPIKSNWKIPACGQYHTSFGGYDKENRIRLLVAIQADAADRGKSYRFYLTKSRKIERLEFFLVSLGIPYTKNGPYKCKGNQYSISFSKQSTKLPFLLKDKGRVFTRTCLLLSPFLRKVFLEELPLWDGSPNNGVYFTSDGENAHLIQEMAVLTNRRSSLSVTYPKNKKPKYIVGLGQTSRQSTYIRNIEISEVQYQGQVYCPTVPSGMVVIRRYGKVGISGNSQEPRLTVHLGEKEKHPSAKKLGDRWRKDPLLDVHGEVAKWIERDRNMAKIVFLGLCYNKGQRRLCEELNLPLGGWNTFTTRNGREITYREAGPEGKAILEKFHALVPFVRRMSQVIQEKAEKRGQIRTLLGRLCRFRWHEADAEYMETSKGLNRWVQGSAGDQTKKAMVDIDAAGYNLQVQVHDEVSGSRKNRQEAEKVARIMEQAVKLTVPSVVDVETGPNWGAVK